MPEAETPPPVPTPAPAAESQTVSTESTGLPRNVAAGIATFFPLLGGALFLVLEKKDRFVRFYAMQSVFLGGLLLAVSLAVGLAELIFRQVPIIGWLVALGFVAVNLLFSLAWLVIWVIAIVKALSNVEWEVPVLGAMARKRLGEAPQA
jgi:uncharacterized membrane protein